ncbi:MAG: hypothetical protein NWP80_00650 [Candidatus Gracilibacteria bacterium]|nr:hypothetical protein [Candidatus Gracilibacteria bacterium]
MEDIILKYKKQQKIRNISIVITSLCLALALNIFINTNNYEVGNFLKGSLMDSSSTQKNSDIYLEKIDNENDLIFKLKSTKDMENVKNLSISMVYNNENVSIDNKFSDLPGVEILNLSNTKGFNTILLTFAEPININKNSDILNVVISKLDNKLEENLNIISSNFTDKDNKIFMITSEGIKF